MGNDDRRITPDSTVVTAVAANPFVPDAASEACLVVILGAEIGKRIRLEEREGGGTRAVISVPRVPPGDGIGTP